MLANDMPIFWIIFNLANLQCLLVICFTDVEFEFSSKIKFVFWYKIVTINPVAVAKFFHIICNTIFISLFDVGQTARGLFRIISNYFAINETNGFGMHYLYSLLWPKRISHLATFPSQIQSNMEFHQWLLLFWKVII